ncbi:phosphohistidine phosphatase SixA [Thermodesulfobacteriota bacterium]
MKLYLLQHGTPVPKEENPDRPLSSEGRDDINRMALFLEKRRVRIEEIFHSGKSRARQSAEIMISRLSTGAEPTEKDGLSPLDDVSGIAEQVKGRDKDLMIAGHLPHLSKLASLLVTGSESVPIVAFQQGGVVCLSRDKAGAWNVAWMLVPEII